ncbi:MAG: acyl carrier protein [Gammaproteobacteria bacterium]
MQREEIFQNLKAMIEERFDLNGNALTMSTTQSELGIDSILMVDLMMDVEERLDITFKNLELPRNPALGDIVGLVEANLKDLSK